MADFRRACRAYAERFIGVMTEEFQRLGVFGDWEHPYLTMDFRYQAAIARALGRFVEQGLVYKGKKPVHWCIHCRTALAEAEVEYEDHTSPSIYVEFPLAADERGRAGSRVPALAGRDVSVLIWTTTPWTIPSNLAIAFHPEFDYARLRRRTAAPSSSRKRWRRTVAAVDRTHVRRAGRADEGRASSSSIRFRHPLYARDSLGVLGDYVTLEAGTGAVHTAPGHGADDFITGVKYGLEIYAPVGPGGHFLDTVELFGGQRVFDANPHDRGGARRSAAGSGTARTFAHSVSALLALPQPGDLPGDVAVVHPHGRRRRHRRRTAAQRRTLREAALDAIDDDVQVDPGVGPRPHLQHGGEPARLVHLAPARLGRADSGGRLHDVRRGDPDAGAGRARRGGVRRARRRRVVRAARSRSSSLPG